MSDSLAGITVGNMERLHNLVYIQGGQVKATSGLTQTVRLGEEVVVS